MVHLIIKFANYILFTALDVEALTMTSAQVLSVESVGALVSASIRTLDPLVSVIEMTSLVQETPMENTAVVRQKSPNIICTFLKKLPIITTN